MNYTTIGIFWVIYFQEFKRSNSLCLGFYLFADIGVFFGGGGEYGITACLNNTQVIEGYVYHGFVATI